MENFKLDLTKLTPVAQKDRVKGNWYVVADKIGHYGRIVQWNYKNTSSPLVGGGDGTEWKHWFAIPSNLPGFPVQELPDEFELKGGECEYYSDYHEKWMHISALTGQDEIKFRRIKPKLPTITIPEQTESERREWLQKELEKLN